jgi:hypothetical protein
VQLHVQHLSVAVPLRHGKGSLSSARNVSFHSGTGQALDFFEFAVPYAKELHLRHQVRWLAPLTLASAFGVHVCIQLSLNKL